jgi:hypothetical protein
MVLAVSFVLALVIGLYCHHPQAPAVGRQGNVRRSDEAAFMTRSVSDHFWPSVSPPIE